MTTPTDRLTTALAERYRIERHLGEGGMATVYLAEDRKHKRKVALKVLRPELAAVLGAERFIQEITTTAGLQHPHILPLYDSGRTGEDADGQPRTEFLYYVMPYIQGETLREKLSRETQLGIDEAVRIASEVADALDYAHQQGVIHRDIKPENILMQNGRALVADFGIALAVSAAAGGRMTETGLSLGTPHYMSPEQATAEKHVTNRSDVYSLGCVLFEMLTGEPPHTGASAQAIIMKIVTDEARPITQLRKSVPPHVAAAVAQALEKLPADRFESAKAFADALHNAAFTGSALPGATAGMPFTGPSARRSAVVPALGGATLLLAALAAWGWLRSPAEAPRPPIRYQLELPFEVALGNDFGSNLALSPDGTRLVYASATDGVPRLWMRERHQLDAKALPGTEQAHQPFFSPDGTRVGFVTWDRQVKIVSLSGEPPITLVDSGVVRGGGAWSEDGYVYLSAGSTVTGLDPRGLVRVSPLGGPLEPVTRVDSARQEIAHYSPVALPGNRGVVFAIHRTRQYDAQSAEIAVVDLRTGLHRVLLQGTTAVWSPTGHLLVVRADGALVAAPFDPARLEVTGPPTPLLDGVQVEDLATSDIALSRTGTLVFEPGRAARAAWQPVWVTREGRATPIDSAWAGRFRFPALSPDGRRLAITVVDAEQQIWVKQLERGPLSKLTFEGRANQRPAWTPDGRFVSYLSDARSTLDAFSKRADGSGQPELLLDVEEPLQEITWSRDGRWLVARVGSQPGGNLVAWRPGMDSTPTPLVASAFDEVNPALSPDGRWVAYSSNESGRYEVYVRPFPDAASARWQVSTQGGTQPLWAHSGRELFFIDAERQLVAVEILPGAAFAFGAQHQLFSAAPYALLDSHQSYDVTRDDRRFVMIRTLRAGDDASPLIVVDNYFTELAQKTARP